MNTPDTPLGVLIRATTSVHTQPRMCQWCGRHEATLFDLDGAWCCELHRDADRSGQTRPEWRPVPAGAIHDGYGCCVWCANQLGSPDCPHPLNAPRTTRPIIVFGGNR